ncbi:mobilome CxxCx(11)CxxC protein [Leptospira interrogans]|uniref:mobilome CxxCx(11)CxxC protein n=1 Tax=Leptospira interrogans TaxID=173 RepID=UPI001F36883C|nr:mobilome CxxCx(11)CxxC protein [Leptospira interrogans]UML83174.1 transposase [Leptospira interrogans]
MTEQPFMEAAVPRIKMKNARLKQIKMDALSARALYRDRLFYFNSLKNIYMLISICGSISFLGALYIARGTYFQDSIEFISTILSVITILYAVITLIYKYDDNIIISKNGIRNNTFIASEVDSAISTNKKESELHWFYRYVSQVDTEDNDFFSGLKISHKQKAYREALKESTIGNIEILCARCNRSPWDYEKGDCQLCGNQLK